VKEPRPAGLHAMGRKRHGTVQGSTPVSVGCDQSSTIPCFFHTQLRPVLSERWLAPAGHALQLLYPSCWARGRFQAAESRPCLV